MFSLICAWTNGGVNNRYAGDLRRHRAHYDVTVMSFFGYLMNVFPNVCKNCHTMTSRNVLLGLCDGNHRSPVDSNHKGPSVRTFDVFLCFNLNNHLATILMAWTSQACGHNLVQWRHTSLLGHNGITIIMYRKGMQTTRGVNSLGAFNQILSPCFHHDVQNTMYIKIGMTNIHWNYVSFVQMLSLLQPKAPKVTVTLAS